MTFVELERELAQRGARLTLMLMSGVRAAPDAVCVVIVRFTRRPWIEVKAKGATIEEAVQVGLTAFDVEVERRAQGAAS